MKDSIIILKLEQLKQIQDSNFVHLNKVEQLVLGIKNESLFLKLLPLIGVIIGGLITWWIQKSLKDKELKLTLLRELKETSNKILTAVTSLQFHLKELAYLEVDSKYQYYLSQTEETADGKKRAMDEHYNDYKYISDVKTKISSCVADINSNFVAYHKLTNKPMEQSLTNELLAFTEHILALKRELEFNIAKEVTTESLNLKIENLSKDYTKDIKKIMNYAQKL
jgi:hypothetical protein